MDIENKEKLEKGMKMRKKVIQAVEISFVILLIGSLILTVIEFSWANVIATISILLGFLLSWLMDKHQNDINKIVKSELKEQETVTSNITEEMKQVPRFEEIDSDSDPLYLNEIIENE